MLLSTHYVHISFQVTKITSIQISQVNASARTSDSSQGEDPSSYQEGATLSPTSLAEERHMSLNSTWEVEGADPSSDGLAEVAKKKKKKKKKVLMTTEVDKE